MAVAVVVPLAFDAAEQAAMTALTAACAPWPMPFHATECEHPEQRVKDADRLEHIRAIASASFGGNPRAGLFKLGGATLSRVRRACGEFVQDCGGWVLLCGEHDVATDHADPWPRMVNAAVEEACVSVVTRHGSGPHEVDVRVAKRTRFALGVRVRGCTIASFDDPLASALGGLQLADVFAHALGPRGSHSERVTVPESYTVAQRRHAFTTALHGVASALAGCGALDVTHGLVMQAVERPDDAITTRLRASRRPLPACTLSYSVEGSLETVLALGCPS